MGTVQNWTFLCGEKQLTIWQNDDIGLCFRQMVVDSPTSALMAAFSAFYLGNRALHVSRHPMHLHLLTLRKLIVLCLLICPLTRVLGRFFRQGPLPAMEYISAAVQAFGWLVHILFLLVLRRRITIHSRGPKLALFGWLLTLVVTVFALRTCIITYAQEHKDPKHSDLERNVTYAHAVLQVLYFCTLIPKGKAREAVPKRLVNVAESVRQPLVADSYSGSYGAVTGRSSAVMLGVAENRANFLSRLALSWVNPLLRKGSHKQLNSTDDLFELPGWLKTSYIDTKFWIVFRDLQLRRATAAEEKRLRAGAVGEAEPPKSVSILRALISSFGVEYFLLATLKLLADGAIFTGPLLLNLLVTYIQSNSTDLVEGYYYVLGLFGTSFLSALCSAHYSYFLNNVMLKVRAAVVSTIYRKTLHLRSASMSKFNTGEIVNFMSTDTECIVNMCNFHEFWSMPIKIAACLFLLHQQVGLAYVAGIGFAILLIPVNHWIARRIGKLSTSMMNQKDKRVKVMTEILYGIRVIKFYSWEALLWDKIQMLRSAEVHSLKERKYLDAFCVFFWATTPIIISLLTFTTYILLGNTLTVAKVFTCMALFNMLIVPLNAFPWVIGGMVQGYVSVKRVQKMLEITEANLTKCYSTLDESSSLALYIRNGTFNCSQKETEANVNGASTNDNSYHFQLESLDFEVHKGQFIGIVGSVGSGKTSLLLAIMAELERSSGEVGSSSIADGFAYVAQDSWIQNATIRQNILFGRTLQLDRYYEVLQACALEDDLKAFPAGDDTLVGERGITLSGGQKTRIALARAIYQDKDIYLMDDILSTVDVHVGQHIMQNCIHGLLSQKTRLLCTHHWKHLSKADGIIALSNGKIIKNGHPTQVLNAVGTPFDLKTGLSDLSVKDSSNTELVEACRSDPLLPDRQMSFSEEWERGSVKWKVYQAYGAAVGSVVTPLVLITILLMQTSRNLSDWWLAHWMSQMATNMSNITTHGSESSEIQLTSISPSSPAIATFQHDTLNLGLTNEENDYHFYLMVYGILAGINAVISLIRAFSFAYGGIIAAVGLHNDLLRTILRASMKFFDVTPVGRIVNRFSTDTYVIDDELPFVLNIFLAQSFTLMGTLVVISYSLPWLLLILFPLGGIYFNVQNYYRHTSRELRRLEAITLSPMYAHFSESVLGLVTIRAFRSEARFKKENEERLEKNQRTLFALGAAGGWLSLRLQLIGVAVVTGIGLLAVLEHHFQGINPGLVGLALSYGLSMTATLSAVVQYCIETEKQLVSVERTLQYFDTVEPERWEGFIKPPLNWPERGVVAFHDVTLRYRENLPVALNKISFETKSSEKIGIVGRTGAGKSSLFSALFRLIEVAKGGITIDGVVLAYLDLKDLRSKVTVIPQDPFIFSGTVRSNLDPFDEHTDDQLWSALRRSHLSNAVERVGGLDAELRERGVDLSMGQRQLLCLARAILTDAKVLCIDEATANVDHETDSLLQKTIRSAFKHSTVLTIAHRLETVLDSDRILVMHEGTVAEFDIPSVLLDNTESHFHRLVYKQEWSG